MRGREDDLASLLDAALAGDEKAYADFLRHVAGFVRAFARRRTGEGGIDAEDIVQETLLAIHLKRHTWRKEVPVMAWVATIARHKLIDAFRRRGRRLNVDLSEIAETHAQPQTEGASAREIGRALDLLTPGQRDVVAAITVQGSTVKETAERLKVSETAVRVALHRGLAAIGRKFGQA